MKQSALEAMLKKAGISYRVVRHKPVFTVAEACAELKITPDAVVKNILLKDDKGFFVVVIQGDRKMDFGAIAKLRSTAKVMMASPEEVKDETGVEIGSVSLLSFPDVLVESGVKSLSELNIHPDDNKVTLFVSIDALNLVKKLVVGDFAK